MTTSAEYLAALSSDVRELLLTLVRTAADTDDASKVYLMSWLMEAAEAELKAITAPEEQGTLVQVLSQVAQLFAAIYNGDATEAVA